MENDARNPRPPPRAPHPAQAWPLTTDPNPLYILGSFFLPYSWALHVAAWIQKNNGK